MEKNAIKLTTENVDRFDSISHLKYRNRGQASEGLARSGRWRLTVGHCESQCDELEVESG